MSQLQSALDAFKKGDLIIVTDDADREKYAPAVWDLIQQSYAKIGGIKGKGFSSPDDMIMSIPFWKLFFDERGEPFA